MSGAAVGAGINEAGHVVAGSRAAPGPHRVGRHGGLREELGNNALVPMLISVEVAVAGATAAWTRPREGAVEGTEAGSHAGRAPSRPRCCP